MEVNVCSGQLSYQCFSQLYFPAAWFPGGPGGGYRIPQRQAAPTADGYEGGGPLLIIHKPQKGLRRHREGAIFGYFGRVRDRAEEGEGCLAISGAHNHGEHRGSVL